MPKIIAGEHRGRTLSAPRGQETRPTASRVREAIFNLLAHHPRLDVALAGARVLDLFAGSGAMGLEAISRGASSALFVDRAAGSVRTIGQNIARLGVADRCRVLQLPAERAVDRLAEEAAHFDVIFVDPPYRDTPLRVRTIRRLAATSILAPGAVVVVEGPVQAGAPEADDPPGGLARIDRRAWGETEVVLYRHGSEI